MLTKLCVLMLILSCLFSLDLNAKQSLKSKLAFFQHQVNTTTDLKQYFPVLHFTKGGTELVNKLIEKINHAKHLEYLIAHTREEDMADQFVLDFYSKELDKVNDDYKNLMERVCNIINSWNN